MVQPVDARTHLLQHLRPEEESSIKTWVRICRDISRLDEKMYGLGLFYLGAVSAFAVSNIFFQAILPEECQPQKMFFVMTVSLIGLMAIPILMITAIAYKNIVRPSDPPLSS